MSTCKNAYAHADDDREEENKERVGEGGWKKRFTDGRREGERKRNN
jgi:hypothetical protein